MGGGNDDDSSDDLDPESAERSVVDIRPVTFSFLSESGMERDTVTGRQERMKFTIPLEPRTKKNHQMIARGRIIQGEAYRQYEKDALWFLPKMEPISEPVNVKAVYYMKSYRRVDLTNLESALLDILVKGGVLADDNWKIVYSTDGSHVEVDSKNPRTEVEICYLKNTPRSLEKGETQLTFSTD